MAKINARAVLTGFTLELVPKVNPLQNQSGQVVGAQVESSSFSPRVSTYIVDGGKSLFRGEKSFTFGAVAVNPEDGVHKGLPSKKDFFARKVMGDKSMQDVLAAFQATASSLLDDTADGKAPVGTVTLDYRIDQITAVLTEHDLANNFVQVDFGIYEVGGKQRLSSRALRYIPDQLVEPQNVKRSQASQRMDAALVELAKLNEAAESLDKKSGSYQLELIALAQKMEQQQQVYTEAARSLETSDAVTFFPMSQLWAEVGIPQAVGLLVACVFAELAECSYLLAGFDQSNLAAMDLDGMLYLYANMQPKPEAETEE